MKSTKKSPFNPQVYLESFGVSRKVGEFRKKQTLFAQGDAASTVMYIQKVSVKFTVVSEAGKEAVVAIFGAGDFLGEGAMGAQSTRLGTATAIVPTTVPISQQTLAEMVGTTRSRVNFFMNKFRKRGLIDYNGKITIEKSLVTVILHE